MCKFFCTFAPAFRHGSLAGSNEWPVMPVQERYNKFNYQTK